MKDILHSQLIIINQMKLIKRKLNNLSERTHTFYAEINGEFPENIYPAEDEFKLKSGAQVMFLKNDTEGKQYFNGKIGIVTWT